MSARLKNITLRQLRAFAITIQTGSLSAAADKLGVTQPAISLQLQNLRELATMPIMQRTPDGFIATDAGRDLMALHERFSLALSDCIASLEAMKGVTGGRVAVGAVSTSKYFVPAVMGAFSRANPGIELQLKIGNRSEIMAALRDFSLDIAITGRPLEDIDLDKRRIGPHPHVIIAAPSHVLQGQHGLKLADLAAEGFIMREPGSGTRLLMERLFEDCQVAARISMELDSNETIKQAVMAGLGIAFISGHTVATEIREGRLIALDVVGLPLMREWFVVRRADRHILPPAARLMDFLTHESVAFLP